MDLIHAEFKDDNVIEDIEVLQDYSFDEVYGVDENNFECRVQAYNHRCRIDDVLYVEFTEYGGIIDRMESDKKSGEVIYKGRTWHGVMNSHAITSRKAYSGEINSIMAQMIDDADMGWLFVVDAVPLEDREITVNFFEASYEKLYDAIVRLLKDNDCKLICYFQNGKVHIGAVMHVDYSHDEEFDASQVLYRIGKSENNVNHLICLGQGEGINRAVIHLFTNDLTQSIDNKAHIQPYTLVNNPLEDNEYILDERNKIMTGKDEITEILDVPNAEIITNYKLLEEKPNDWNLAYHKKYYEDGDVDANGVQRKQLLKQIARDEYRLLGRQPDRWTDDFKDYYYLEADEEDNEPHYFRYKDHGNIIVACREGDYNAQAQHVKMSHVKQLSQSASTISWIPQNEKPNDWDSNYSNYYTDNGSNKEAVSGKQLEVYGNSIADVLTNNDPHTAHDGNPYGAPPIDWSYHFSNYYTRNKNALQRWVYSSIEGVHHFKPEAIQTKSQPTGWKDNWGNYYVNVKKDKKIMANKKIVKVEGHYITARDAMSQGKITKISDKRPYPKYQKGKFYVMTPLADTPPDFNSLKNGVFEKFTFTVEPDWEYPTKHYYVKHINNVPTWVANKYYEKIEDVEQIPDFGIKPYYRAVYDRYRKLVEQGIEKLEQLNDTSTLDINLELSSNYDIFDVIGTHDNTTDIDVAKPILRKIIKIKKNIVSIEYEVE